RKEAGQAMAQIPKGRLKPAPAGAGFSRPECPKCGSDDESMIEVVRDGVRDSRSPNPERSSPESRVPSPGTDVLLQHLRARVDRADRSRRPLPVDRAARAANRPPA